MKKIPTIFKRNPENMGELLDEPHPDCQWVFDGEGVATKKYDGTCVMINSDGYFKRREVKFAPEDFVEIDYDETTGKKVGWVPIKQDDPNDKYHILAFYSGLSEGTYELVGPKIQGNPEKYPVHILIKHSEATPYGYVPRTFEGIKQWLKDKDTEGIVFHHPDGRMGKIKKKDFNQNRT
ncbi:MAG TPA: hypothetical protein ENI07_17485 [Desulfobacterales bacterium]|nr:hypothetical protein [Desulfobacterales bacterium]